MIVDFDSQGLAEVSSFELKGLVPFRIEIAMDD